MVEHPTLRGRETQLAVLVEHLAQLREGAGFVAVIEGAPGFGKTRLLQEAVARAHDLDLRAGHGMADPFDRVVDLAPLLEALFDNDPPLLDRQRLDRRHTSPDQRYWLLSDLEALLARAADEHPLLICLDDLQWADNGTAAALRVLPRRLAGRPVGWVLATRTGRLPPQVDAALAGLIADGATRLALAPLTDDAVQHLVADLLAAAPDDDVLRAAARTRGNPFLLVELARGWVEERLVAVDDGRVALVEDRMPRRVSGDMRKRLTRMTPEAENTALAAASLGRRFSVADLAALTELGVGALAPVVRELVDAGILAETDERLTFGHDLVRDAVRASVPAAVRREFDRRSADVLLARGALPVEVATQLASSAVPGDEVAIATLTSAAEQLAVTDPAASADLAGSALALTDPADTRRGPLAARRAISLFAAGRTAEAKAFADTTLRDAMPPLQEAQVRLSVASMFAIAPDVRADSARAALSLPGLPAELRAWLEAIVLHNLVVAGRTGEANAAAPSVRARVGSGAAREATFALDLALGGLAYQDLRFDDALTHLDDAVRAGTGEDVRSRLAHYFRCWPLAAHDRFDDATAVAEEGLAAARRDRQHWAVISFETWRGLQALQTGRLADAAAALGGRLAEGDGTEVVGIIDAATLGGLARLHLHVGDERGSREVAVALQAMLTAAAPSVQRHAAWALASQAMAHGDAAQAHRMLCALGRDERLEIFPLFPHDVALDAEMTRIALAVGDDELVTTVLARARARLDHNPRVRSVQAAARHVGGLVHRSEPDLAAAAELFGASGRPLAQVGALGDLGVERLRGGDREGAVGAFDRALVGAVAAGATHDAALVRSRLRELGIRRRIAGDPRARRGWPALTPAEVTVAELVAEGRTNREIGDRLFVSPHTVSAHLRHIFDKLGVHSRVELSRAAVDRGAPAERHRTV